MAVDRTLVTGLLTKMGVEAGEGLSNERLEKKLLKNLGKSGMPDGASDEEKSAAIELGWDGVSAAPSDDSTEGAADTGEDKGDAGDMAKKTKPKKSAKKADKPGKVTKVKAPADGKKPTTVATGKPRGSGVMAAFKEAFKSRKKYERKELTELVIAKAGAGDKFLVANYIAIAKKPGNSFGFQLTEEISADKSKKFLIKVG